MMNELDIEKITQKAPLGVKPRVIFQQELSDIEYKMKEDRYEELFKACLRYCDSGKVIPRDWIVELESLRSNYRG